jgi:hypothetical protein
MQINKLPLAIIENGRKEARHIVTHSNLFKQSLVKLAWKYLLTWGASHAVSRM